MALVNLTTIKSWFETGKKPTQVQFWNVFDSFFHKNDTIPIANITDIETILSDKADTDAFNNHKVDTAAHQDQFDDKVDKVTGFGLSENNYDNAAAEAVLKIAENSTNKQVMVIDASGDFSLVDADFRTTFFINTTGAVTITIPTATLRAGWVAFFHVIGTGQLNIVVDGLGATINAPDGTLLSQGNKGMIEKQLSTDTFHLSGGWES